MSLLTKLHPSSNQHLSLFLALMGLLSYSKPLSAQPELCMGLLQRGIYDEYKITNTGDFNLDFRSYLLSEQFQRDLSAGKWGAGITIPIEGNPFTLAYNADENRYREFRSLLLKATSFKLDQSYYQTMSSSIANTQLASIYKDCLIGMASANTGFSVLASYGDDWATFQVIYRPTVSRDPMPRLSRLDVLNGTNLQAEMKQGQEINNTNIISVRRDRIKDLILIVETDRGATTYKIPAEPPQDIAKDLPVGTVIASCLNYQQFARATGGDAKTGGIWSSATSTWAPADGRRVTGSLYSTISQQDRVPDLRGVFLRGRNQMDPYEPTPPDQSRVDPQGLRPVGDYQEDTFKSHTHHYREPGGSGSSGVPGKPQGMVGATTGEAGGAETRPKNVVVYYYIRIN